MQCGRDQSAIVDTNTILSWLRFNLSAMDETKLAIDKLQRIQQLWTQLGRTKSDAPEYGTIMKEIRALSAEYQNLIDPKK